MDETIPVLPASTHREVGPGASSCYGTMRAGGHPGAGRAARSRSAVAMAVLPTATLTLQPVALRTV